MLQQWCSCRVSLCALKGQSCIWSLKRICFIQNRFLESAEKPGWDNLQLLCCSRTTLQSCRAGAGMEELALAQLGLCLGEASREGPVPGDVFYFQGTNNPVKSQFLSALSQG